MTDTGPLNKQLKGLAENHTGITIFDKVEPRSVYNLVPPAVQETMEKIDPKYYDFRFSSLEKHLKPDIRDYQLRISFWREYYEVQDRWLKGMTVHGITRGICNNEYFYRKVLTDPLRLAFILYPVTDLAAGMLEIEDLGLREMRKILKMPNSGKRGANLPVIREKIKIFALVQNRNRGAVLQRIQKQVQSKHHHVHTQTQEAPKSLDQINKEIRQIERTVRGATEEKDLDNPTVIEAPNQLLEVPTGMANTEGTDE